MERWLPIPGYEGRYEVSDLGSVRSFCRDPLGRLMKTSLTSDGYPSVDLFAADGTHKTMHVSWLVMRAFVGPRPRGEVVRHFDDDKLNNLLENLAYGTRSENEFDKTRNGHNPNANKTHCPRGHEYTPENTRLFVVTGKGRMGRKCRACHRMWVRQAKQKVRITAA